MQSHHEAKAALNNTERAVRKARNAVQRLSAERRQTKGELTEAEVVAEKAYQAAFAAYLTALENWQFVLSAVPKPTAWQGRQRESADDEFNDRLE